MKILLTGGGTGGSVTPLLAVANEIRLQHPEADFLFIGTHKGPEEIFAQTAKIPFRSIHSGKYRRYFSLKNLRDPFLVLAGFFESISILRAYRPDVVFGAGAYVSVPVIWAAWFLGIPSLIHQQDVNKSFANQLCQRVASRITVTFEWSLKDFPGKKTRWIGNPIRPELLQGDRDRGMKLFGLDPAVPTVLVFGGGTGAQKINELMVGATLKLTEHCQIIHLYGRQKELIRINNGRYHGYEFLADEMKDAFAVADVVVCRAGLGSLTEVATLGKSAVIIPMPATHQEANAMIFHRANAGVIVDQRTLDPNFLVNIIIGLLSNKTWRQTLEKNIRTLVRPDARQALTGELLSLVKKKHGT